MSDTMDPNPSFIAQEAFCFYRISDFYGPAPRFLFYILLVASIATRRHGWLFSALLGAAATYAGTAAIHAFILLAGRPHVPEPVPVSIPYVSPDSKLVSSISSLVTGVTSVMVQPGAVELDTDAILAIVVTGYLVFLPMQCWSRVARRGRARYYLILLWSFLMLLGTICALVLRPDAYHQPRQYMFCQPEFPSDKADTNEGWPEEVASMSKHDGWNSTVWNIFQDRTLWESLADNCFHPCFTTRQILRKPGLLEGVPVGDMSVVRIASHSEIWQSYVYAMVATSTVASVFLLFLDISRYESRVPYANPRNIWKDRNIIFDSMIADIRADHKSDGLLQPARTCGEWCRTIVMRMKIWHSVFLDIIILTVLVSSMLLSPLAAIVFAMWIEWNLTGDGSAEESAKQVAQWAPSVSIGLLLVSAMILQLKYRLATKDEIEEEIEETKTHLKKLEMIVEHK
ncbi:uncharacterized protein K452DRAFT_93396 [Aplosporella prunicola CBS 121167]|uniref:Uncharacterized protein n=1 Tax=Aplosporella prunicola CBS 121167 TaxID=1176127 RepID=A0A6A6B1P6_9PEZI|nr:uncharacterized protein K452DRAFT_93396 [Aplosporella prunicola CBS 121167]KAF2137970.1 hypothetical protein K452DRAFT_93396 [Aplosporella prunicola CBS 121167]